MAASTTTSAGCGCTSEQLTAARRAGALNMVEHALTRGFFSQIATGAWAKAAAAAAEACRWPRAPGTAA